MKQRFLPITFTELIKSNRHTALLEVNFFRCSHPEHILSPFSNSLGIDKVFHTNVLGYRVSAPGTAAKSKGWSKFEVVKITDTTLRRWSIDKDSAGLHSCFEFIHFFFLIHIDIQRRGMSIATVSYKLLSFCDSIVNIFALYMASTGESFSCANSSLISTDSTSPIRILVSAGTVTPAISAIVAAFCPTILAFSAPLIRIVFLTFSISSFFRK